MKKGSNLLKVDIIKGCGGIAMYIDGYRVSSRATKPLGGGTLLYTLKINREELLKAIDEEEVKDD